MRVASYLSTHLFFFCSSDFSLIFNYNFLNYDAALTFDMQFVGQPLRTSVKIFLLSIKKILYVYDFKNISENH